MAKNTNTNKRPTLKEFYEALTGIETRIGQLELNLVRKITEISVKLDNVKEQMNHTSKELNGAKGEYRTRIEKAEDDCNEKLDGKVSKGWFTAVAAITGLLMLVVVVIEIIRLIGG